MNFFIEHAGVDTNNTVNELKTMRFTSFFSIGMTKMHSSYTCIYMTF